MDELAYLALAVAFVEVVVVLGDDGFVLVAGTPLPPDPADAGAVCREIRPLGDSPSAF